MKENKLAYENNCFIEMKESDKKKELVKSITTELQELRTMISDELGTTVCGIFITPSYTRIDLEHTPIDKHPHVKSWCTNYSNNKVNIALLLITLLSMTILILFMII